MVTQQEGLPYTLHLSFLLCINNFLLKPPFLILYSVHSISNRVKLANEFCKITFSKFSVKSFLAKPLNDLLSYLTACL